MEEIIIINEDDRQYLMRLFRDYCKTKDMEYLMDLMDFITTDEEYDHLEIAVSSILKERGEEWLPQECI